MAARTSTATRALRTAAAGETVARLQERTKAAAEETSRAGTSVREGM